MNDILETIRSRQTPYSKYLGVELIEAAKDQVSARLKVKSDLCTFPAILHGGAVMSLADNLGAVATVLNLPAGKGTTTLESKTNFLAPIPEGQYAVATCEPLHRGRKTMVWQTKIRREDGRLCAIVTQTQMVLDL